MEGMNYKKSSSHRPVVQGLDSGFSLLEMLIALAIMSLTSLALFQSIGTMLNVSDRAVRVSERTLEMAITRESMSQLVDGLVEDKDPLPERSLLGKPLSFSGVSANAIHSDGFENASFKVSLDSGEQSTKSLVYGTGAQSWVLETGLPPGSYFEYLGRDNTWYKQWPQAEQPALIPNVDDILDELVILKLPRAIRLTMGAGQRKHIFVVGRY